MIHTLTPMMSCLKLLLWDRNPQDLIFKLPFSVQISVTAANSVPSSVSLCGHVVLAGWSCCPVEVRETLPQQFSFPGSAHQTRVSQLGVQNHILGAETDPECGL